MTHLHQNRNKTRSPRPISALALGALLTIGGSLEATAQESKTLRVADMFPENHYLTQHVLIPFMKGVEERTDGRLQFQHYPAGQLVKAQDMLDANSNGLADITSVVPLYSSDQLPLSGVIGLPGYNADAQSCTRSIGKVTNEVLAKVEYSQKEVYPLIVVCTSPYQILTTRNAVSAADDLAGLKIRSPGGLQELVVDQIGAVPVSMPSTDIFTSLQRGTIDGVSASLDTLAAYSLEDLAKSVTTNGQFGFVSVAYVINEDVWGQFDDRTKEALEAAAREAVKGYLQWAETSEEKLIADWKSRGIDAYEIPQSVLSNWSSRFEPLRTEWAARMESKGLPGDTVLSMWAANVENRD